jgi:DNA replication protein DnaC
MTEIELQRHREAVESARMRREAREAEAAKFTPPAAEPTEADFAAMAAALIPPDMPVTSPEVFRAYVFKTEICERLKSFGFDPRFWTDGLLEHVQPKTRESKQAYVLAKVEGYLTGKGAIVALTGDRGVGKTTIVAQIAIRRLWDDWRAKQEVQEYKSSMDRKPVPRRSTLYRKLTAVVGKLKALYADFGTIGIEALESYRDHLAQCALLVVDELNECADDSKHKERILTDIVDRRYSSNRDTILLTNQKADEFEKSINPSILSRLNEHGAIIPCDWESFREKQ